MARRLELVLRGFGGALDGAQEANLRGDGRDDFVLLRLTRFVLRLEILQERLQIVTGLLHFRIQRVDFSRERIRSQRLLFLDQLGLLFVAQVDVFGAARRAEVLARPRLERLKVAAALVRVTSRRRGTGEVLERRVTLHAVLLAEGFLLGAVDVADDDAFVIGESLTKLLPRRRKRLAVTTPAIFRNIITRQSPRVTLTPHQPRIASRPPRSRQDARSRDRDRCWWAIVRRSDESAPRRAFAARGAKRAMYRHLPGSVELDEGAFSATDLGIKVFGSEIHGDRVRATRERKRGDGGEGELDRRHRVFRSCRFERARASTRSARA